VEGSVVEFSRDDSTTAGATIGIGLDDDESLLDGINVCLIVVGVFAAVTSVVVVALVVVGPC
jgi:hypothetical protein